MRTVKAEGGAHGGACRGLKIARVRPVRRCRRPCWWYLPGRLASRSAPRGAPRPRTSLRAGWRGLIRAVGGQGGPARPLAEVSTCRCRALARNRSTLAFPTHRAARFAAWVLQEVVGIYADACYLPRMAGHWRLLLVGTGVSAWRHAMRFWAVASRCGHIGVKRLAWWTVVSNLAWV